MTLTKPALGRLEKVELREYWQREDTDFTPWLASDENLALLGEALGMELALEDTEVGVGPFRADILAKDTASGAFVLVENQLERTDHSHLGQILTYAAGLEAVTTVWVAQRFTDEHRAALDWLNRVTDESIHFFGIEVELWRIGDSPPAPKFNVVCKPNDWSRRVADAARSVGAAGELYLRFWTGFSEQLRNSNSPIRPPTPRPQGIVRFALGRTGFMLYADFHQRERWVSVGVGMEGTSADQAFELLLAQRAEIESAVGEALEWHRNPAWTSRFIFLRLDLDPNDEGNWPRLLAWMQAKLEQLDDVFRPRVRAIEIPRAEAAAGQSAEEGSTAAPLRLRSG